MSKVISAAKQAWSAKDQITRNIWLAGLGAYDKGYESASSTVTKSQSIFDELVERGRKLEADTSQSIHLKRDKLTAKSQSATDAIQQKVQSAVSNLTHIDINTFDNIIDKIEQIELALAEAKKQQDLNTDIVVEEIDKTEPVIEKVATTIDNAAKTTVKAIPAATKTTVKDAVEKVAVVKKPAKKITNKRLKKAVAKKN